MFFFLAVFFTFSNVELVICVYIFHFPNLRWRSFLFTNTYVVIIQLSHTVLPKVIILGTVSFCATRAEFFIPWQYGNTQTIYAIITICNDYTYEKNIYTKIGFTRIYTKHDKKSTVFRFDFFVIVLFRNSRGNEKKITTLYKVTFEWKLYIGKVTEVLLISWFFCSVFFIIIFVIVRDPVNMFASTFR